MPQQAFSVAPYRPDRSTFWQNSFYNLDVTGLDVHDQSATWIAEMTTFHEGTTSGRTWVKVATYGTEEWLDSYENNAPAPYFMDRLPEGLDPDDYRTDWHLGGVVHNPANSTPNPQLWWSGMRQEGITRNPINGDPIPVPPSESLIDKHAVLWSPDSMELLEAIQYLGGYGEDAADALSVVTWDLTTYTLPLNVNGSPAGVVAINVPVSPFGFCYQDVLDNVGGNLGHMLGWVPADYRNDYNWPARSTDGELTTGAPGGSVWRLKDSFDTTGLDAEHLVIVETLQTHGMMIFDRKLDRPSMFVPADPGWPEEWGDVFDTLLDFSEFDVVDMSSVVSENDSIEVASTVEGPVPGALDLIAERIAASVG